MLKIIGEEPRFKRTSIGLDLDGTLFDFYGQFVKFYNAWHPDDKINVSKITKSWDLKNVCKYNPNEIFELPGFYSTMKPYKGAKEVLKELYEKYDTHIVTTTPMKQIYEREVALKFLYPKFDKSSFILATDKSMIKVDVLFDDAPHNFSDIVNRDDGQIIVTYNQDYNRHLESKYRVDNPYDILEFANRFIIPKNELKK